MNLLFKWENFTVIFVPRKKVLPLTYPDVAVLEPEVVVDSCDWMVNRSKYRSLLSSQSKSPCIQVHKTFKGRVRALKQPLWLSLLLQLDL